MVTANQARPSRDQAATSPQPPRSVSRNHTPQDRLAPTRCRREVELGRHRIAVIATMSDTCERVPTEVPRVRDDEADADTFATHNLTTSRATFNGSRTKRSRLSAHLRAMGTVSGRVLRVSERTGGKKPERFFGITFSKTLLCGRLCRSPECGKPSGWRPHRIYICGQVAFCAFGPSGSRLKRTTTAGVKPCRRSML